MSSGSRTPLLTLPAASQPEIVLPNSLRRALDAHCDRVFPEEACGLLAGQLQPDGTLVLTASRRCVNRAEAPTRAFVLDPLPLLDAPPDPASAWAGIYHSHPTGSPLPSAADVEAAWPGLVQLVIGSHRHGPSQLHAYVVRPGSTKATELAVREQPDEPTRPAPNQERPGQKSPTRERTTQKRTTQKRSV